MKHLENPKLLYEIYKFQFVHSPPPSKHVYLADSLEE